VASVLFLQGLAIGRQAVTSDEAYHALAGEQADRYGRNGLNLEHPPLVKLAAALPLLAGPPLAPPIAVSDALRTQWAVFTVPGAEARVRAGGRLVAGVVFGLPLLLAAFLLGRELGGAAAGAVLALALGLDFSVFPLLPLIYTDAAEALGFCLTLLAAGRFLRRPDLASAALLGLAFGLALAVKFTGVLLLPALGGALLLARGLRAAWRRRLLCGLVAAAVAWAVVELTYLAANRRYDAAFGRETIHLYCANRSTMRVGDLLRSYERPLLALERRDPRAAQWLTGLLATRAQDSLGVFGVCNFGRMSSRGRWWYFPVLLLAKTPLPLLAATACALAAAAAAGLGRRRKGRGRDAAGGGHSPEPVESLAAQSGAPLEPGRGTAGSPNGAASDLRRLRGADSSFGGPPPGGDAAAGPGHPLRGRLGVLVATTAAVYLAVAAGSNYNAGIRHLLPILPLLYLPAALWAAPRPRAAAVLLLALLAESLALAPVWSTSTNTWWLGERNPLRFALALDNAYYPQNLLALREAAERCHLRPLRVVDPAIPALEIDAYLGRGVAFTPPVPAPSAPPRAAQPPPPAAAQPPPPASAQPPQAAAQPPPPAGSRSGSAPSEADTANAAPLAPGWYAVGASAEVCVPAILRARPAELFGYSGLRAIAAAWGPVARQLARQAEDHGWVAGTFHLYRVRAAPAAAAAPPPR
jgi:Dolichyl-phosphate-mannose-protein mannosyltransferase